MREARLIVPLTSALAFAIPACQEAAVSELTSASTVYFVGPTRSFHTLQDVQEILQAGDVVNVDYSATPYPCGALFRTSGTVSQPITIHGTMDSSGRRPLIKCGVNAAGEFSAVEFRMANHWVFENFEIDGNRSGGNAFDANLETGTHRLIRTQSDDITLRNLYLHNCPAHGILTNDDFSGSLTLENSEVADCGNEDLRHSVYISTDPANFAGATCRVRFNYIHDGANGILLKSRCQRNEIYYNWLENFPCHFMQLIGIDDSFPARDLNGNVIPYNSDVVGNVFYQPIFRECYPGQGDSNAFTLGHDWWEATHPGTWGQKRFVNNTIVLPAQTTAPVFKIQGGIKAVEMHNNVFKGPSSLIVIRDSASDEDIFWTTGSRRIAGSYNWVVNGMHAPPEWTFTRSGSDPGFSGAANFRPAASSPLVDAGSPAAPTFPAFPFPGPAYPPSREPVRAATSSAPTRAVSGTIDIGAFEAASGSGGCTYSISPTSTSPAAAGGAASVTVTATSGCSWSATSNDAWITVTAGSSGAGSGTVSYSVAQNTSNARTGTITIAGQTFTVNQAAAAGGTGLLSNPGFESWSGGAPTSWTKSAASTLTQSTTSHGGSFSCQVQDPDWKGITQTVPMTKPSGTTLTGSAWVRWVAGATTSPFVQLVISYSDGNPTDYVGAANASFTTSGWYQLTKIFTVTHPVSSVDVNVVNNSGTSETWLVDDVSLTAQ